MEEKLKKVRERMAESKAKFDLEIDALTKTQLDVSVMDAKFIAFKPTTEAEILKVLEVYPPRCDENALIKFASKDSIETNSPFILSICNYKHIKKEIYGNSMIKYETIDGMSVWMELSMDVFPLNTKWVKVKKDSTARNPEMCLVFSLPEGFDLICQRYVNNHFTYYGTTEQFYKLFKQVFTRSQIKK